MEMFLMMISIALATRFGQINARLIELKGKVRLSSRTFCDRSKFYLGITGKNLGRNEDRLR